MVPEGNGLSKDFHIRRRGSVAGVLVLAVLLVVLAVPLFALCVKMLYAAVLVEEARTTLEASATCAFPALSLARLTDGIGEVEMEAFREWLTAEIMANTATGPLQGCVIAVEAILESEGTVRCTMRYRPGRPGTLDSGFAGEVVPDEAVVSCRVDLPVEP